MKKNILIVIYFLLFSPGLFSHISDIVFDDTQIHEFHLTFHHENFWDLLWEEYDTDRDYIPADFEFDGQVYLNVGVKFKGLKSMSYPTPKKPFKIKFDKFVEDQEFYGLKKLSLSNGYYDPTCIREKISYDLINKYLPASRTNFIKLYINGDYWGLYTNVEQVDKKFLHKNFGANENGNLFKGDPAGTLEWHGYNQESYYNYYELKTNEDENDWSDLVNMIDVLNNSSDHDFQDSFEQVFHIHNYLCFHAINNFLVNLDSYFCSGHNYYVYHRTDSDRFIHIPWDFNTAFGTQTNSLEYEEILNFSVLWEHPNISRPLGQRPFDFQEYVDIYLKDFKYLIEEEITEDILFPRIDSLADLIRPAVYADTLKMFSNQEFEEGLELDLNYHDHVIFGLKSFISNRINSIEQELLNYTIPEFSFGLFINEFLANNDQTLADEFGEYDDWLEIYNANEETIDLSGMFLSDNPAFPDKWKFPDNTEINAGEFLIVWLDNDPEQGDLHTNFKLNEDGEFIGLYYQDGVLALDSLIFNNQSSDISFGRYPDGSENWQFMPEPTPETSNIQGNYPPQLSDFHQIPLIPSSSENVNVTIKAIDDNSINSVILYYSFGREFYPIYMFDNGQNNDGFAGDAVYGCYITQQLSGTIVSYYIEAEDNEQVIARFPENNNLIEYEVDYNCPSLFINEFLALNRTTNQDPEGEYDDWIEIYNASEEAINISGMYITDDLTDHSHWYQIPETNPDSTTIQPGDFILLWADNDSADGILHLGFNLTGSGEQIGLFAYYGTTPIDTLSFGIQSMDVSFGRNPDGSENWEFFTEPTPAFSNTGLDIPQNLIIYFQNGSLFLEWDAVPGAEYYSVYSSYTPDGIYSLEATNVTGTIFEERNPENKKFYYVTANH